MMMEEKKKMSGRVVLTPAGPYDLELSLRAASRFLPEGPAGNVFREAVRFGGRPSLMEAREVGRRPVEIEAVFAPAADRREMRESAEWILHTDLDLRPFYRLARDHAVLGPMIKPLRGLVAVRTPSLFFMAVTAVIEQQISLLAAFRIRQRVIERYGDKVDGAWVFPTPETLARATIRGLKGRGLSTRKAEYIIGLSRRIVEGSVDLDKLKAMGDQEAREYCMSIRGLGPWAADYILIRGLGRPDALPADDLGLQKLVGFYLGKGERLTTSEVRQAMEPFAPYRGVAVFYMMVHYRLYDLKKLLA